MSRINRLLPLVALILLSMVSCEDDIGSDNPLTQNTFAIRHDLALSDYHGVARNEGEFSSSEFPDFSSVVSFAYSLDGSEDYDYLASGVLVSQEWILTAGHNFFDSEEQSTPAAITGITVVLGDDPNQTVNQRSVAQIEFHPTWLFEDDGFALANDLCLIRLSEPITTLPVAGLYAGNDEPIGALTWHAGFGDFSEEAGQDPDLFSPRRAWSNELDRKISDVASSDGQTSWTGGLLAIDFDSPLEEVNSLGDDLISPDEPDLGSGSSAASPTPYEGCSVEGDSGGPVFMRFADEWLVVGILSGAAIDPQPGHQDADYGEIDIYIRVSTAIDWIQSIIG